jgi:hypothetical protein
MNCPLRSLPSRTLNALFACTLIALIGCKSTESDATGADSAPPKSAEISQELTAVAQVTAIDRDTRVVTLKREDGTLFTLTVGNAARNFDQLAVGDQVRARYKATLAVSLRPPGETAQAAQGAAGAARTEAGAKPGVGVGIAATVRVKVESLDLARDIVTLSLASGELISHRLATPEGRAFAKGLKVGDVVQIDYSEALALSVEEL